MSWPLLAVHTSTYVESDGLRGLAQHLGEGEVHPLGVGVVAAGERELGAGVRRPRRSGGSRPRARVAFGARWCTSRSSRVTTTPVRSSAVSSASLPDAPMAVWQGAPVGSLAFSAGHRSTSRPKTFSSLPPIPTVTTSVLRLERGQLRRVRRGTGCARSPSCSRRRSCGRRASAPELLRHDRGVVGRGAEAAVGHVGDGHQRGGDVGVAQGDVRQ